MVTRWRSGLCQLEVEPCTHRAGASAVKLNLIAVGSAGGARNTNSGALHLFLRKFFEHAGFKLAPNFVVTEFAPRVHLEPIVLEELLGGATSLWIHINHGFKHIQALI